MKRHRKHVKVNIKRAGAKVKVLRASGGTENGYGKTTDSSATWDHISTEYAAPHHQSGETFRERSVTGGTRDIGTPTFRFPFDTVAKNEDRIIYENKEYEVKSISPYRTHKVVQVVSVNA